MFSNIAAHLKITATVEEPAVNFSGEEKIEETRYMYISSSYMIKRFYHKLIHFVFSANQGPAVQGIVSLTSLLMTNSLTVVAKVFSNTLKFLLQKCEYLLQCKSYSLFF